MHPQKLWDVFEINNLGEYHDLHVQSDTLLLEDEYFIHLQAIVCHFEHMKTLEICVLKKMNLILHISCLRLD